MRTFNTTETIEEFNERLRIDRLEEIERLIAQHSFALEQLNNEKEFLTPKVNEIKQRIELDKKPIEVPQPIETVEPKTEKPNA